MNRRLEIRSDSYFESLADLKILSDSFFEFENKRFTKCLDSASNISHQRIMDCGCSVGMLVRECQFLDSYYWILNHEIYDGVLVNSVNCNGSTAVCELKFYYGAPTKQVIDEYFSAKIELSKYDSKWLIDKIEPERRRRN